MPDDRRLVARRNTSHPLADQRPQPPNALPLKLRHPRSAILSGPETGRTGRIDDSSGSAIDQNRIGRATGVAHGTLPEDSGASRAAATTSATPRGRRCCGRAHETCGATVRYRFRNRREQQPAATSDPMAQDSSGRCRRASGIERSGTSRSPMSRWDRQRAATGVWWRRAGRFERLPATAGGRWSWWLSPPGLSRRGCRRRSAGPLRLGRARKPPYLPR